MKLIQDNFIKLQWKVARSTKLGKFEAMIPIVIECVRGVLHPSSLCLKDLLAN